MNHLINNLLKRLSAVLTSSVLLSSVPVLAVNTIHFSALDPGVDKSVPVWGVDTAWPSFENVRQSIHHIGSDNVDIARVLVYYDEPLVNLGGGNFELNAAAKAKVDNHLNLVDDLGANIPLTFGTARTFLGRDRFELPIWPRGKRYAVR